MPKGRWTVRAVLCLWVTAVSLVGCGAATTTGQSARSDPVESDPTEWTYVVDEMRSRDDIADRQVSYSSYWHLLPNVSIRRADGTVAPVANRLVVGTIAGVSEGRAFKAGGQGESQTQVGFDDPAAQWRTVHMTVIVDENLGVEQATGERPIVDVGLAISGGSDPYRIMSGLKGAGRVALPLIEHSPVFADDPEIFAIVEDGMLLARIDASGTLSLPFQSNSGRSKSLLLDTPTLADLEMRGRAGAVSVDPK